jgi:hypothetical protein
MLTSQPLFHFVDLQAEVMFTVSLFVSSSLCGLILIGHDRYRSADLCHGRIGDFVLDKVSLLSPL